jgi:hypothetical protein
MVAFRSFPWLIVALSVANVVYVLYLDAKTTSLDAKASLLSQLTGRPESAHYNVWPEILIVVVVGVVMPAVAIFLYYRFRSQMIVETVISPPTVENRIDRAAEALRTSARLRAEPAPRPL